MIFFNDQTPFIAFPNKNSRQTGLEEERKTHMLATTCIIFQLINYTNRRKREHIIKGFKI